MAAKLKISIGEPTVSIHRKPSKFFTGRLIGFIDKEILRAIVNTPEAARKIYTSDDIEIKETPDYLMSSRGLRFVIATADYTELKRLVFISPVIKFTALIYRGRIFTCMNGKEYRVEEATL